MCYVVMNRDNIDRGLYKEPGFVCCADDSVLGWASEREAQAETPKFVAAMQDFGLSPKQEWKDGESYPPGLIAPFLSRCECEVPGTPWVTLVAIDLGRRFSGLVFMAEGADEKERFTGVAESIAGNLLLRQRGYTTDSLEAFCDEATRVGVDLESCAALAWLL